MCMSFSLISESGISLTFGDFFTPPYQWQFCAFLLSQILLHFPYIDNISPSVLPAMVSWVLGHLCTKHSYSSLDQNIDPVIVLQLPLQKQQVAKPKQLKAETSWLAQNVLFMTKSKEGSEFNSVPSVDVHKQYLLNKMWNQTEDLQNMMHSL